MKKLFIFLTFLIFFSCEKQEIEKQQCWICTETAKRAGKIISVTETEVCDIIEVTKLDGKRYSRSHWSGSMQIITWYYTECELKY